MTDSEVYYSDDVPTRFKRIKGMTIGIQSKTFTVPMSASITITEPMIGTDPARQYIDVDCYDEVLHWMDGGGYLLRLPDPGLAVKAVKPFKTFRIPKANITYIAITHLNEENVEVVT